MSGNNLLGTLGKRRHGFVAIGEYLSPQVGVSRRLHFAKAFGLLHFSIFLDQDCINGSLATMQRNNVLFPFGFLDGFLSFIMDIDKAGLAVPVGRYGGIVIGKDGPP